MYLRQSITFAPAYRQSSWIMKWTLSSPGKKSSSRYMKR